MSHTREDIDSLPVACTLTPDQLASRREDLLPGLVSRARDATRVAGGFRWRFEAEGGLLSELATVIDEERRCCRFLRFQLLVEPGGGPVWLEVTGPEGTEGFLSSLVDAAGAGTPGEP